MSDVSGIEKITDRAGTGAPDFTNGFNIAGSDSGISPHKHTEGATEPSSPSNGDAWWDSDNDIYKGYMNNAWQDWLGTTTPPASYFGDRAHWASGGRPYPSAGGNTTQIDYWNITSLGNAADFGDVTGSGTSGGACASDATKIYFLGSGTTTTQIDYWTSATLGNAADFGDTLTASAAQVTAAAANGTKCLYHINYANSAYGTNIVEQFATGTVGVTASDFGDLTVARWLATTVNSDVRCVFVSGQDGSYNLQNVLDYFTFATAGNVTDFGDLSTNRFYGAGVGSNGTARGLIMGGYVSPNAVNTIDYITIATPGNGTDHGDLTQTIYANEGCANGSRACTAGGVGQDSGSASSRTNVIEYTALTTPGNAADFGDLSEAKTGGGSASGAAS